MDVNIHEYTSSKTGMKEGKQAATHKNWNRIIEELGNVFF